MGRKSSVWCRGKPIVETHYFGSWRTHFPLFLQEPIFPLRNTFSSHVAWHVGKAGLSRRLCCLNAVKPLCLLVVLQMHRTWCRLPIAYLPALWCSTKSHFPFLHLSGIELQDGWGFTVSWSQAPKTVPISLNWFGSPVTEGLWERWRAEAVSWVLRPPRASPPGRAQQWRSPSKVVRSVESNSSCLVSWKEVLSCASEVVPSF